MLTKSETAMTIVYYCQIFKTTGTSLLRTSIISKIDIKSGKGRLKKNTPGIERSRPEDSGKNIKNLQIFFFHFQIFFNLFLRFSAN